VPTIEPFCAPGVYDPRVYSQGVKVTGAHTILVLSGQVSYDKEGGVAHPRDFKGQAREVMGMIKALVESQGGTLQNVLRLNSYVTDMRYRPDYAAIGEQFFGKRSPASTLVEVSALAHPDWLIEIEAIAVV
jgi:enamine deaminase RidA (YjgF/YER057c/UK114 family)